ncbi:hypothetical protein A1O1_08438 [Capronia coronata CBS 617.96]|uniref:F-box domain-containing protein n=1 Tax=Capronia coronata CBS 617.96 TaxID=1182541 RepID=W9XTH5_9EURO|nr:uncharacterized protein A1O1_08438 [Capronia coronata CBS 617.96]EXJ80296.1 hypothetical protein A1O1_08438 [Capronia coronata CBS 617.96]
MAKALGDCDTFADQGYSPREESVTPAETLGLSSSLQAVAAEDKRGPDIAQSNERPQSPASSITHSHTSRSETDGKAVRVLPKRTKKPANKPANTRADHASSDDEPLIDTTAQLALHSKKTARMQRRQEKKQSARKVHSEIQSFLDLPPELLTLVLSFLQPSDIYSLLRLNRSMRDYVLDNENAIAEDVMSRRYWVLRQCFPLPVTLDKVPDCARPALLSQQWQDRLRIHKNPYQHIKQIDPTTVCTCMSCVLAWNNLCIILDLAHWQPNLDSREPLPIIPRGRNPEWNVELLEKNAQIVMKAMYSPLAYGRILQVHLNVTTRTILRSERYRRKGDKTNTHTSTSVDTKDRTTSAQQQQQKPQKPRLYHLTDEEAAAGTDEFLERSGPPSYQPIYMRDNYYSVEAFVPSRKWDRDEQRWQYYSKWPRPHENDLAWLVARFTPTT